MELISKDCYLEFQELGTLEEENILHTWEEIHLHWSENGLYRERYCTDCFVDDGELIELEYGENGNICPKCKMRY